MPSKQNELVDSLKEFVNAIDADNVQLYRPHSLISGIDAARKEIGMSRRQLAIAADLSPSTLQSMVERDKDPPMALAEQLVSILNKASSLSVYIEHFQGAPVVVVQSPGDSYTRYPGTEQRFKEYHHEIPQDTMIENLCLSEIKALFEKLNDTGRQAAVERIREMTEIERYTK